MATSPLDAFFAQYYRRHPVTATYTGVHDYDDRLPDWSRDARDADVQEMRVLRVMLEHAYPARSTDVLKRDRGALDAELAVANLDVRIAEHASGFFHDRNPALWTGEAIFGAVVLMIRTFAPVDDRLEPLSSRLSAIAPFLATMRETIVSPVPDAWRLRALRECRAAQELFGDGLRLWLEWAGRMRNDALPERSVSRVHAASAAARQAFADAEQWLESRPPAATDAYGCGAEMFATLLRRGHYCPEAFDVVLARASADMETEAALLNARLELFGGDWNAAQAAMAMDAPTFAEYPAAFEQRWLEIRSGVLSHDVLTWPLWPIRYVPIPDWARDAAPSLYWLFYRSPAPFDRYDVHDYLITPIDGSIAPDERQERLAVWNRSTITLNHVIHHGGMGHHVQNWHAIHRSASRVGIVSAVDAASRIGMFLGGSMAEGWACYATLLAEELGLLTPLEALSEQHSRVRFLARAIVDIRLHHGEWSFDTCVAYYQHTVGMSHAAAVNETSKNSMFPATALMYWLGTSAILDLRAHQRDRYGERFSLRTFHDGVLCRGAIPVLLASTLIRGDHAGS